MSELEPIHITFEGDVAALIRAEAIIEKCSPDQVVRRALGLYGEVAPEIRNGGRLIIEVDATNDTIENRRGLGRLATRFANMLNGNSSKTVSRYSIQFPEIPMD